MNNLFIVFAIGVLLILLSTTLFKPNNNNKKAETATQTEDKTVIKTPETSESYEAALEHRLEEALTLVEGAGKVKVMLTIKHGNELIVQSDSIKSESRTNETDSEGGQRSLTETSSENKTVMVKQTDGSEIPLVLVEAQPKVEGVIIISEGGNNIVVKDALIRAAEAVLSVEAHKIQILKMK